ncbi:MAG: acyl-[acyl-carrier-protein] thioesterase [Leptospira sp.]|jgi:acyl-CoA thioesterase FadM|nr:acyl-[acyl-carrier-protein] thioesterase [Leptospira sp.]
MNELGKDYTNHYVTRIGDIDYNEHVNGSRYEFFAEDARMQALSIMGVDIKKLIKNHIALQHKGSHFQFLKQRTWNEILKIETTCDWLENDKIQWNHLIYELESGELAAKIVRVDSLEEFEAKDRDSIQLYAEKNNEIRIRDQKTELNPESNVLEFSLRANTSDRNGFHAYPLHQLFKLVEEVRWLFSEGMGLTLEAAKEMDCIFFTTESNLIETAKIYPGQNIQVKAFISDYKKVSCTLQQLFFQGNEGKPFLSVKETMLAISPSRMAPRRIPDELFHRFLKSP